MNGKSSSVSRIVARFGGQNAMARAMGIRQSTIWNWTQSGHIPQDRMRAVKAAGLAQTPPFRLTAADFLDLDDEPQEANAA